MILNEGRKKKILVVGRCCTKKPKFSATYDNEPLDNFIILLCTDHVYSDPYTKNVIKVEKLVIK